MDSAGYANVRAFFAMLEQLGPEAAGLEEQDCRNFAPSPTQLRANAVVCFL